jgi:diguanylate cyclase (GGDEF)-like protein
MRVGFVLALAGLLWLAPLPARAQSLSVELSRLPVPATVDDVRAGHYEARFEVLPAPLSRPVAGQGVQWLRLRLPAERPDRDLVLAIDRVPVDAIVVHVPVPGGGWRVLADGTRDRHPGAQFSVCCYAFALPREIPGGVLYLAVEDAVPSGLAFSVGPWDEFAARDRVATSVITSVLLILLAMALVNAVFLLFLGDRLYAWLIAFQLSMVPWLAYGSGLLAGLPERALPGMPGLFPWLLFGGMSAFFATGFIQRFCGMAERFPAYARVVDIACWVVLGITALSILPLPQYADLLRHAFNFSLLGLALAAFATPVLALRTARRPAVFLLLAFAVMVGVVVWQVRFALGWGEQDLVTRYGVQVGVAVLALVLTVGLADRALDLRQQRDRAQFQRDQAESRLRIAQTRRALAESLETLVQHAGSDLAFTAYKRALAALRHVLPMRGAAWVAEERDGRRLLVAEPAAVREKVSEFARRRNATLRSVAQTGRSLVLSPTEADQSAADGQPLKAAIVPLRPDECAWSVLLIAREDWQEFSPDEFDVARDFMGLAAKAAAEGRRHVALQQKASFDALTGALNRGNIETTVETAFSQAVHGRASLAVLFIDLDHFKRVNDQHGHAAGDECLVRVTQRIEHVLKPGQALGRYGGEEFLVVLPGAGVDEAQAVAERIRATVRERPIATDQIDIPLTVSIGGASRQAGELSWKHMLERADQALYTAKRNGRDRVVWGDPAAAQTA